MNAGEFVVLMGRNGSGKSTLLKQIVGLIKPGEGQVTVAGLDTRKAELDDIIKTVGYVPQHPGALLFGDTLAAELAFTRRGHAMPADPAADQALLERLGLGALADRNPRDLSGGEQQRAGFGEHPGGKSTDHPAGRTNSGPRLCAEAQPDRSSAGIETRGPDHHHGDPRCRAGSRLCRSCRADGGRTDRRRWL